MVTCDYLIIGAGFAGIGLKYKLLGKTILIDKDPFRYKIGESHIPSLINCDLGLLSLIPKIMKMKSYTHKRGSIFCDSFHGRHASNIATPLGAFFAWHCERQEIEKLLVKELSVEIQKETILDIDLSQNLVKTDQNTYRFKKYLLDCTGPAMVIANKLNLVSSIDQFQGMKAQWSYWAIDSINKEHDSWANWTVLNKIALDSWIWQIPIYHSSVLSMGMLHRGEPLNQEDLIDYLQERSAACYRLTSISRNPKKALKPYMNKVHSRLHYSKRSSKCSGDNWILVGDSYCFADPVYSVGSGVAMLEAITIANNLNDNHGQFDHDWYEERCTALIGSVIKGIGTWYSGTAFDKNVNAEVNRTILQGGFARHFTPSEITDNATDSQTRTVDAFSLSVEYLSKESLKLKAKVYFFDKGIFLKEGHSLFVVYMGKRFLVTNKAVQALIEKYIIGRKFSLPKLYLLIQLNLFSVQDREYFWKFLHCLELLCPKERNKDRLVYFHPGLYQMIGGRLKLGDDSHYMIIKNAEIIDFYERLKGRIVFVKNIMNRAAEISGGASQFQRNKKIFLEKFYNSNIFGNDFVFKA